MILKHMVLALCLPLAAAAFQLPAERHAREDAVRADVKRILARADLPENAIEFQIGVEPSAGNIVRVGCPEERGIMLEVRSPRAEWASTLYYGLRMVGFLFPHPRIQISPTVEDLRSYCGAEFQWKPRVRYRGFHLHTAHPSEWVPGFLGREDEVARDMIRWLARNGQNVLNGARPILPPCRTSNRRYGLRTSWGSTSE
jgi:hypothetical protein